MLSKESKNILIVLAGPTAVGKTSLAIDLAKHFNSEIFSADSRQIYTELNIGTAKPSIDELSKVTHHLIGNISVTEKYNVKKYEENIISQLEGYYQSHNVAILTGGTGFYIQAALYGMDDIPDIPLQVIEEVEKDLESAGLEALTTELVEKDPNITQHINIKNPRRVIRALAVTRYTGTPFSDFRKGTIKERNFIPIKILLERDRSELYERINARVDNMLEEGLLEEVKSLVEFFHLPALQTVGYRELIALLNKEIEYPEAVRLIKRNSRRYAKRQITWFKNQDVYEKFHPDNLQDIKYYIEYKINYYRSKNS